LPTPKIFTWTVFVLATLLRFRAMNTKQHSKYRSLTVPIPPARPCRAISPPSSGLSTINNQLSISAKASTIHDPSLPGPANQKFKIKIRKLRARGPVLDRRSAWERIPQIDTWIRSGSYPNAKIMAARLQVTERTVGRDIEFMRAKRGMPIAFDPRRNGFYYTKPVERLSTAQLTQADIFAILIAQKAVAQYRGTSFGQPLAAAFNKLIGQLDHRELHGIANLGGVISFRPFAPEENDIQIFQTVTQAVAERRELKFRYRNAGKSRVIPRWIQPYHLLCCDQRWYLLGFDVHHRKIKTYALCRILEPKLQQRTFDRPENFNPNAHFEGSLGVMKGDKSDTYKVIVELDPFGADLIRGRQFHPSQKLDEDAEGRSRLSLRLGNLDEIERAILSWGAHATVLEPECLRQRLAAIGSALVKTYGAPATAGENGGSNVGSPGLQAMLWD
ncbi:MAG TPA: WYL domain-containing protein, partial [Verrucomicrobiae bacterium]|nr:WYL domain-containing protein [Verrucomicrobiae bacterium]